MNEASEEVRLWFVQAEEDFASARYLLEGERFYLVCFVCQQVAEKSLKAYLIAQGEEWIATHSVERLCRAAEGHDPGFRFAAR